MSREKWENRAGMYSKGIGLSAFGDIFQKTYF
jgi:hypothetical protein